MDTDLHSIIANLDAPGRILVFCDETDLTFESTSTMVGELHLYGGVILRSETYQPLAHTLTTYLAEIGQAEFHGTEVVNPGGKSNWKSLSYGARVEALRHVCAAIAESNAIFAYARICKAQFDDMVRTSGGAIKVDNYKGAVKQVFLRCVAEYLTDITSPTVLLIDREKNTPGPSLVKFEGGATLAGGGAISANSACVLGLQIADVVAYAVGRSLRRRDKIVAADSESYDPFDKVIMEFVGGLRGRLHEVLQPALNPLQML
jgi:hypothetical protein